MKKIIARLAARQVIGHEPVSAAAVGDILPARIIRKTGPDRYLVEMHHHRLHVESALRFSAGEEVYVQVQELAPRTRLRLISAHREHLPRMIDIARKERIFLDDFNRWCLAELLQNRYSFTLRDTAGDVEKIRALSRSLFRVHLIPLPCYVRMLSRKPQVFDAVASIMRHDAVGLQLPDREADSACPEAWVQQYAACYRNYHLGGPAFHPDHPELAQISRLLQEAQSLLDAGYALGAFLVPVGNRSRLVAVEHLRGDGAPDAVDRYQMNVHLAESPPIIITARLLGDDVHLRLAFADQALAEPLRRVEHILRRLAAACHKNLLPVQHEVMPLQPLLAPSRIGS